MPNISAPAQTSFNAGELSPLWSARVDMAKYGNGCNELLNFKPLPEGPIRRRDGTIYVGKVKDNSKRVWLQEFIYSATDSYVLEFGDGYIRFFTDNGRLLLPGKPALWNIATNYAQGDLVRWDPSDTVYYCKVPNIGNAPPNSTYWHAIEDIIYEIPSPYPLADLTDSEGLFRLDFEQTGDALFITHPMYAPHKLTRNSQLAWVINPIDITDGPFEDVDPDQTITVYSSAETGSVTLTASADIFNASKIGTLFLIEQRKADSYPVWEVGKTIALNAERRSDSNVYKALNAGVTGTVKPTHRLGARFDGDTGVQWDYLHSGYGIVRIDSVGGGGTTAGATVLSRIPSQAVGAPNASTRWAYAAWRSDVGYPSLVKIFRERLCFARGQQVWGSVAGVFESFASRDGAETLPDSAFSMLIGSSESNAAVWMVADDALLIGTRRQIFAVREVTSAEVFGPGNIKADEEEKYSARQVQPVKVGGSTIFSQYSGRKWRDVRYTFAEEGYQATDLMVLSGHVLKGQTVQMKYALEPSSIIWTCCVTGELVGLTYLLEQDVIGWHPHRIGGDGIVESIAVIPSPEGSYDQLWLSVRRTIDGGTKRYIERMSADWDGELQPLQEAIYCDSAGVFDGTVNPGTFPTVTLLGGATWDQYDVGTAVLTGVGLSAGAGDIGDHLVLTDGSGLMARVRIDDVTTPTAPGVTFMTAIPVSMQGGTVTSVKWARDVIAGLDYLEGEAVDILAEGSPQAQQTVVGGQVTLAEPAWYVVAGLPCPAYGETMRIEAGAANGISQGKIKRIIEVTARLHESLGGALGPASSEEALIYRDSETGMDTSPGPYTGDLTVLYPQGFTTDARIRWNCDQPLPFTLCGLFPRMTTEDKL